MPGYEGYAEIDGNLVLATSVSAPYQRNRLESNSAYKGTTSLSSNQGIGYPHTYDFQSFDGSMNVEITQAFFNTWKNWLISRTGSKAIRFQTRSNLTNGVQIIPEAYWTSLSLETGGAGSAVTSSISLLAWNKTDSSGVNKYNTVVDNYIDNKKGSINTAGGRAALKSGGSIPALNVNTSNITPVPFWKTSISSFGANTKLISWSVTFNQDITKQFTCAAHSISQPPEYLVFGPVTGELTISLVTLNGTQSISDEISNVVLNLGVGVVNLGYCQDNTFADELEGQSDTTPFNLTYQIYGPIS
jgi:hypothetical protein